MFFFVSALTFNVGEFTTFVWWLITWYVWISLLSGRKLFDECAYFVHLHAICIPCKTCSPYHSDSFGFPFGTYVCWNYVEILQEFSVGRAFGAFNSASWMLVFWRQTFGGLEHTLGAKCYRLATIGLMAGGNSLALASSWRSYRDCHPTKRDIQILNEEIDAEVFRLRAGTIYRPIQPNLTKRTYFERLDWRSSSLNLLVGAQV
jgi:hypothetical protein